MKKQITAVAIGALTAVTLSACAEVAGATDTPTITAPVAQTQAPAPGPGEAIFEIIELPRLSSDLTDEQLQANRDAMLESLIAEIEYTRQMQQNTHLPADTEGAGHSGDASQAASEGFSAFNEWLPVGDNYVVMHTGFGTLRVFPQGRQDISPGSLLIVSLATFDEAITNAGFLSPSVTLLRGIPHTATFHFDEGLTIEVPPFAAESTPGINVRIDEVTNPLEGFVRFTLDGHDIDFPLTDWNMQNIQTE